jgi:hypothetical protein
MTMDDTGVAAWQVILSGLISVLVAFLTTSYQLRREYKIEKEKEGEHIRITYLHPLLVASQDFLERITDIRRRRKSEEEKVQMLAWFKKIKSYDRRDKNSFAFWVNDEGFFAMSTLYITAKYFAYASIIRSEFPFIEIHPGDNKTLLYHIADVRLSVGGKFGIWETIQDSLGSYLIDPEEKAVKNYREFCEAIIDDKEFTWFNRLVDFYRDIDKKLEDQLENIELSLQALIQFLYENLDIQKIEFKITGETLVRLKEKKVPGDIVAKLEAITDSVYDNEIDFSNAVVSVIGKNYADDYMPSILRHAKKKRTFA